MSDDHPFRQPLHAAGLVLRLPTWSDAPAMMEMWDHPTLAWMFPAAYDGSWPAEDLLLEMASRAVSREHILIVENEEGSLFGTVHLNGFDRGEPALGWYVAHEHRRQGVATRAVEAVMEQLFSGTCETLAAYVDPRNDACRSFLEKLGFVPGPSPRPDLIGFATSHAAQLARAAADLHSMRPAA